MIRWYFVHHFIVKLGTTLRIVTTLALVRTFGKYEHSAFDHGFNYARYRWHGKLWYFPTGPIEEEYL